MLDKNNTIPPIPDDWQVGDTVEILETGDHGRIDWILCISRKFCAVDYGRGYGYFNSEQIRPLKKINGTTPR